MIKKIIIFVIILICGIQLYRYMFPPFETVTNALDIYEDKGIELDVKHYWGIYKYEVQGDPSGKAEYSLGKYEFTLRNNTADNLTYGVGYLLQVKRGSEWKSVKDNTFSVMVALELPAESSVSGDLRIDYKYGRLPVGKYRIVKDVGIGASGPIYNVAGEFRVLF